MFKFPEERRIPLINILIRLCNTKDYLKIKNNSVCERYYTWFKHEQNNEVYYLFIKNEMLKTIYNEFFLHNKKGKKIYQKFILEFDNSNKKNELIELIVEYIYKIYLSNSSGEPKAKQISLSEAIIDKIEKYLNEEWTVYFPVIGIDIIDVNDSIKIGDVFLRNFNNYMPTFKKKIRKFFLINNPGSEEFMEKLIFNIKGIWMEIPVKGGPKTVLMVAEEKAYEILDILRFYFYDDDKRRYNIQIDYRINKDKKDNSFRNSKKVISRKKFERFRINAELTKGIENLKLDQNILNSKNIFYLNKIKKIINKEKENRNNLENRIMRAIHWYSQGLQETKEETELINYVMALESVLHFGNSGSRKHLAENSALIHKPLGYEDEVKEFIDKEIYVKRSKVVHGDAYENCNITILRHITYNCIMYILKKCTRFMNSSNPAEKFNEKVFEKKRASEKTMIFKSVSMLKNTSIHNWKKY